MDWRDPATLRELIRLRELDIEELIRSGNSSASEAFLTAIVERDDLQNELEFVLSDEPPSDEPGVGARVPKKPSGSGGAATAPEPDDH
ncbi:MAG TPA: hypothetical protein VEF06_12535 [Bryobacteraceae bacterium]|nr:hypothetical protein [Bryobacteraceae bacterium]